MQNDRAAMQANSAARGSWPRPWSAGCAVPNFRHHTEQDEPEYLHNLRTCLRRVKKHRHISATASILFADIRGYTRLSERMDPIELSNVVSVFQDQCAQGIWAHDGIVNKQMGDGLMAIFNFPIKNERHAEAAMMAALDIQRRFKAALVPRVRHLNKAVEAMDVGVGIHTGQVEIGEFSTARSDFTAIGGTVNLTARLESQAGPGEILVSAESAALAPGLTVGAPTRILVLKGIEHPVLAHVLIAGG